MTISSDFALARGYTSGFGWSFAMWEALQPHTSQFDGAIAWTPARFDLAAGGERQRVERIFASGEYFETLGVSAIRGRTFTAADDRRGEVPTGRSPSSATDSGNGASEAVTPSSAPRWSSTA